MAVERIDSRSARSHRANKLREVAVSRREREGSDTTPLPTEQTDLPETTNADVWKSRAKKVAVVGGITVAALALGKYAFTDKETGKLDAGKIAKSLGKAVAVGAGEGVSGVAGITVRHHRELTHRSLELSKGIQKAIDFEQRSLGVAEPYTWASVHRIHHQMEDASLFPFYQLHHAMQEAESRGIEVPETFAQLDPFVKQFDRKTVDSIGKSVDELIQERLADPRLGEKQYKKPTFEDVTDDELTAMLHPTEPQYAYIPLEEHVRKTTEEAYSQDDIARLLLTDPHSPALEPRKNGVQGILIEGMPRYQNPADMFRAIPLVKPIDLQQPEDELSPEERRINKKKYVAAGFALNAGAFFLANRDFSFKGAARAILEGAAANGARAGLEVSGGNVTNSAGHMGDPVQTEIGRAFLNREYEIKLKEDGTISTNTVGKGISGRMASWATLDEVGGQEIHHKKPWKIKYTNEEGIQAVIEAPWGSALEFLAKSEWFTKIKEGAGFGETSRPDVAHPAVKMLQAERAKQYVLDHIDDETVVFNG